MKFSKRELFERLMIVVSVCVQLVGFFMNITVADFSKAFLPYFYIVVPTVNLSCSVICIFLAVFPSFRLMQSIVFFMQGIVTLLSGYFYLGLFLYSSGLALLFCNGYLKVSGIKKIIICLVPIVLSSFAVLYSSLVKFFMIWMYALFLAFTDLCIYFKIKQSPNDFFSLPEKEFCSRKLPELGHKLNLKDFGLTERQTAIVIKFMDGNKTYKELANIFLLSESSIKREMCEICKKIGVNNATILEILLRQYKIAK